MNNVILYILIFISGVLFATVCFKSRLFFREDLCNKLGRFYRTLVQWMKLKQNGITLEQYFKDRNIDSIAIYGMKELGQLLYKELKESGINVKYLIDKNADYMFTEIDVYKPDDNLDPVDMVIITVLTHNKSIYDILRKQMDCPMATISDVVFSFKVD